MLTFILDTVIILWEPNLIYVPGRAQIFEILSNVYVVIKRQTLKVLAPNNKF